MIEYIVEEDEGYVELLLVEYSKSRFRVLSKFFAIDGEIVLGRPVGVEDRSGEGLDRIDGGEVGEGDGIDRFVGPFSLLLRDEPILEES